MRIFFLLFCLFFVLGGVYGVEIDGSFKAASATNITQGVYEDDMYNKYGDKYYRINVPKPLKVVIKFEIEAGSHSQAIEYEFKGSTLRNDVLHKNFFAGSSRADISFEDSFDVDSAGNYILKISKYNNRFLGDYIFEISFTCLSRENVSGVECVDAEWVNDLEDLENLENLEDLEDELEEELEELEEEFDYDLNISQELEDDVVCEGCLVEDICYDSGTLFNESFCSQNGVVLNLFDKDDACSFDYECLSGECREERCFEPNLWDKIVDFFKELF